MKNPRPSSGSDEARFRRLLDEFANQLCPAIDGKFDFRIKLNDDDESTNKLEMLTNLVLDSADRAIADLNAKNLDQQSIIQRRLESEAKLRESESRMRAFLDFAADVIIIIDKQGIIESLNHTAQDMFGYQAEELVGTNISALMSSPCNDEHDGYIQNYIRTGVKKIIGSRREIVGRRKDGTVFPMDLAVSEVHLNGHRSFMGIVRDISERKQAEESLFQAHAENKQLLDSISSVLIGLDSDRKITKWNHVAETTFGILADVTIGRPFSECGIEWDWSVVSEWMNKELKCDEDRILDDISFIDLEGRERILAFTINPVKKDENGGGGFLLLGEDVTERQRLEAQLAHAQKLESIGQLAAGIAHEINTPTQFVSHNTYFLKTACSKILPLLDTYVKVLEVAREHSTNNDLLDEAETQLKATKLDFLKTEIPKALQQAEEGLDRIASIVRAMKEFSHPGTEEMGWIDLNHAIENTINVARNEWKYVAELKTDLDPSISGVPCYPGELNQVFLNIIINAAQAIAESCGDEEEISNTIIIRTRNEKDWVKITISDTGPGIPNEIRNRIFDPFFTTKEVGKGTGQGLAIAYSVVVDKHHGRITCDSELGKGTCFTILLPTDIKPGSANLVG